MRTFQEGPHIIIIKTVKLKFVENIDIDAANWQQSFSRISYGFDWSKFLPSDIEIENISDTNYLKDYLEDRYYKTGKVTDYKKWIELNTDLNQIQEDLKGITGKMIEVEEITVYITTFNRAPYSVKDKFFYSICRSVNRERSITNIYHELFHFIFYDFWKECEKFDLSEHQTNDFKECLTVILNPVLEKRALPLDVGYPRHQEVRGKIIELWKSREWNFESFFHKVLELRFFQS